MSGHDRRGAELEVDVPGGTLRGHVAGDGPPVLLLHGGPVGYEYLDPLEAELHDGYRVATYQQRGLAPSDATAPYDVPTHTADVVRVLDALGWDRAWVVGHSWGGHLLLNVMADHPSRLLGAVVLDPLGAVDGGGWAELQEAGAARVLPENRRRYDELAAQESLTDDELLEARTLSWPSYFADARHAPPMPVTRWSQESGPATLSSMVGLMPGLADRLVGCRVATVFVHGAASPIPVGASTDTAELIGDAACVVVLPDTGHFLWHESPGAVRRALDDLVARSV